MTRPRNAILLLLALSLAQVPGAATARTAGPVRLADRSPAEGLSELPLSFVENAGQVRDRVAYYVHGGSASVGFTSTGIVYSLTSPKSLEVASDPAAPVEASRPTRRWVVRQDFVGARKVRPEGLGLTDAVVSFFKGPRSQWHTGLRTYSGVLYRDLWPGIDLEVSSEGGHPKSTFHVAPGADPSAIRLAWRGARNVSLTPAGEIAVETGVRTFTEAAPVSWQDAAGGAREPVASRYAMLGGGAYGFDPGAYDRSRPLVIDPVAFVYAGFLGGSGTDLGTGIALDSSGNAYVTGRTASTEATFPDAVGPDLTFNGNLGDAFVARVKADGTGLDYAGYIGGSGFEEGHGIAVDSGGNAYVTGYTDSTEATFPVAVGPDLTFNGGTSDAFVARVKADGTALDYAGYLGGSQLDIGFGIGVDSGGNAYVAGYTDSTEATFPVAVGPDLTFNGLTDAFVARVKADGTGLDYAGYVGGNGSDLGNGIAVDSGGNAYLAGQTSSTEATFPVAVGPDLTFNGLNDAFVARVKADGTGLDYAGYIGGSGSEFGLGIAVDGDGNAYVTGEADSTEATFPATVGPDLTYNGGTSDAFVARVKADGTGLDYAGYLGGAALDKSRGIAVDPGGNAYVTGVTESETFPTTVGPDLTWNGGLGDGFVARVKADGTGMDYAGYLGGSGTGFDTGNGIAVDSDGNAYVTGETNSTEPSLPATVGPDLTHNGGFDAYVAKISPPEGAGGVADLTLFKSRGTTDPVTVGDTFTYGLRVTNTGPDDATGVTLTDQLPPEVSYSSATSTRGTCAHDAGVVTCDLGTIPVGRRADVLIRVVAGSPGPATNTAEVTANETDPTSPNEATHDTEINPAPNGNARTLTVDKLGNGRGNVGSQPAGDIACGRDCTEVYGNGATVKLKAVVRSGSTFGGWGGDCAHAGMAITCTLVMNADKHVTATFTLS